MSHREVMQQALEFCEFLWRDVPLNDYSEDMRQDVEAALRAALAEPEQDAELSAALGWPGGISTPILDRHVLLDLVAKQRSAALAEFGADPQAAGQPQTESKQEPVAWSPALDYPDYEKQRVWANGAPRQEDIDYWAKQGLGITYAYTHPAPQRQPQEPVIDGYPLWSGVPQRQPLSDEDLMAAWRTCCMSNGTSRDLVLSFARVIERAHGIGVKE